MHIRRALTGGVGYVDHVRRGGRARLSADLIDAFADRWYHDFSPLGFPTPQRGGIFPGNQASKQQRLFNLIALAVHPDDRVLELFCADGFYGCYAAQHGGDVYGVDLDEDEIRRAKVAAERLALSARFEVGDVFDVGGHWDVAIVAGGLYHLEDPERLLEVVDAERIVIQTVVFQDDPEYFEAPAPGWTWGCRFSLGYLLTMLRRSGWRVVEQTASELRGNDRPEDRTTAFVLAERAS